MMEPQGEPAGNLKGKFAGLLGAVCSAILSGCLALPLRPGLSSPSPSSQTHHSSLGPFVCFNFPPLSSILSRPFRCRQPYTRLIPPSARWIPPKILLPLTIKRINRQSHRKPCPLLYCPPWPLIFVPFLAARLLSSEALGLAQCAGQQKFASLLSNSRAFFLINSFRSDEMCWRRRWFPTLSEM